MVKQKLALLGATGSIGTSTLQVVREQADNLSLTLATAYQNTTALFNIAAEFHIPVVAILDEGMRQSLSDLPPGVKILWGEAELISYLKDGDYDLALNAISGSAGLRSTLAILETGKRLALANKESLVMAGHLVKPLQAKYHSTILPVDSEHSAIFQAIGQHPHHEIERVHITASGGAFRNLPLEKFKEITLELALKHPNWNMGAKVTLDSATMFNKALEVMEAHWLFDLDWPQIKAVLHPQSVIHSLVEFTDGSMLAQMSIPDMKLPILYALSYPERFKSQLVKTELTKLPPLTFEEIDPKRYPMFYLGLEAGKQGGILPTVGNTANEAALRLFMEKRIKFDAITGVVEQALSEAKQIKSPDAETIGRVNQDVYKEILAQYGINK